MSFDSMPDTVLAAYIQSLRFDADPYAGDKQRLMVGRFVADSPQLARYGPLVAIQPEQGSNHFTRAQLERGRIVARFINQDADSYPKLGILPHGVTYWWIDGHYRADSGRSVFVATDSEGGRIRILRRSPAARVQYYVDVEHQAYPRPVARWYWVDTDEQGWVPCPDGCCRSGAE